MCTWNKIHWESSVHIITSVKGKKSQNHLIHASKMQPDACNFTLPTWSWQGTQSITDLCTKSLTSRLPHFVVKNFWGISQSDPWLILPYPSQRKNFKRVQNVTGLTAFKTLCIRVLITLKKMTISAPGTGKRREKIPQEAALGHPAA